MEVQPFDSYIIKMDGTGRLTKRNRRYLRPITPFSKSQETLLPLQQSQNKLQRADVHVDHNQGLRFNHDNTGPTADRREATTSASASRHHTGQQTGAGAKSGSIQPVAPDTPTQSLPMSDQVSNKGLTMSVRNVHNGHQNRAGQPEAADKSRQDPTADQNTRTKRVKFATKRFIEQF